jgi:DNA-binding response OmpR family regulator
VVENDTSTRELLKRHLQENGYEVMLVPDGFAALLKARTFRPSLIILDMVLPKMDGFMLCQLLRINDEFKNIPVLILSAQATEDDIKKGLGAGANAYLPKPYDAEQLLKKIEELVAGPA